MSSGQPSEPSELIYLPQPSFAPPLVASGIGLIAIGAFAGTAWWLLGLIILAFGVRAWYATADDEVSRMRREQTPGTAVLPARSIRRPD